MNKLKIIVGLLLTGLMTASVIAEPLWVQSLSIDDETISHQTGSYTVGKITGISKHIPYSQRYIEVDVNTELALFDKTDDAKIYQRPGRSDRTPRS